MKLLALTSSIFSIAVASSLRDGSKVIVYFSNGIQSFASFLTIPFPLCHSINILQRSTPSSVITVHVVPHSHDDVGKILIGLSSP